MFSRYSFQPGLYTIDAWESAAPLRSSSLPLSLSPKNKLTWEVQCILRSAKPDNWVFCVLSYYKTNTFSWKKIWKRCNSVKKENNITPPLKNNSSKILAISVSSLFFYITHLPRSKFMGNTNTALYTVGMRSPCSITPWSVFSKHTLEAFPQSVFTQTCSTSCRLRCPACTIIYVISPWSFFLCSFAFRMMPLRTSLPLRLLRPQLHPGPRDEVVQWVPLPSAQRCFHRAFTNIRKFHFLNWHFVALMSSSGISLFALIWLKIRLNHF